jgi:spore germination cell wall hydrolase CwlJ-like protein
MITSLLDEARVRVSLWRHRLAWYWRIDAKDHLPFLAMVGAPVIALASIICFACLDAPPVEPVATPAMSWEAKLAARRENDLQCLAENVYFESRGEPLEGQFAVAEVTLNRTRAQNFPHTICGVVHEMRWDPGRKRHVADFSWTELGGLSPDDEPAWKRAMEVATTEYDDLRDPVVPGALFYHSTSVRPGWAKSRKPITTIGNHVFYR